ncbi:MAG: transcription antitermination protein NusB [Pseudomonadales bacterium]|nr:transcription antitermination protein NusB [Candidatus Woesebacteria bacterium]MCB9801173.1 transcription antitermination protein NusB [Pseudomonadales bacterium]
MSDHRHQKRIKIMQDLFACTFSDDNKARCLEEKDPESTVHRLLQVIDDIDARLQKVAPERPLSEINQVDLAIMRTIVFESDHKETPIKVLINEAVEMAKEFGSESSSRFVNGVLATLLIPEGGLPPEEEHVKELVKETEEPEEADSEYNDFEEDYDD